MTTKPNLISAALVVLAFGVGWFVGRREIRRSGPISAASNSVKVPLRQQQSEQRGDSEPYLRSSSASTKDPYLKEQLSDALRSRTNGNYVLDSEIDLIKKNNDEAIRRGIELIKSKIDREYDPLFSGLGLKDPDIAQLKEHLVKIYKAKMEAGNALTSLSSALADYDARVERTLGDNYRKYEQFETASQSRREINRLNQFAQNIGAVLSPDEQEVIRGAVEAHSAYSFQTLGEWASNPYEQIVLPAAGKQFAKLIGSQISRMEKSSRELLADPVISNLKPNVQEVLSAYYRAQTEELKRVPRGGRS